MSSLWPKKSKLGGVLQMWRLRWTHHCFRLSTSRCRFLIMSNRSCFCNFFLPLVTHDFFPIVICCSHRSRRTSGYSFSQVPMHLLIVQLEVEFEVFWLSSA